MPFIVLAHQSDIELWEPISSAEHRYRPRQGDIYRAEYNRIVLLISPHDIGDIIGKLWRLRINIENMQFTGIRPAPQQTLLDLRQRVRFPSSGIVEDFGVRILRLRIKEVAPQVSGAPRVILYEDGEIPR